MTLSWLQSSCVQQLNQWCSFAFTNTASRHTVSYKLLRWNSCRSVVAFTVFIPSPVYRTDNKLYERIVSCEISHGPWISPVAAGKLNISTSFEYV